MDTSSTQQIVNVISSQTQIISQYAIDVIMFIGFLTGCVIWRLTVLAKNQRRP